MYDYIIVTHIPVFYKVNLYNELSKKLNIFVVFIAKNTLEKRSDDFISLEKANFKFEVLCDGNFQNRDILKNIAKLKDVLKNLKYSKLLVSGWDLKEFWYLVLTNSKSKNCLALESTINESVAEGIKGIVKKLFLSRISQVFASGSLHVKLLNALQYKGVIKITKGVGIINKIYQEKNIKQYSGKFLFVGRLSKEKNIQFLIDLFNLLPKLHLEIIGSGPLEDELQNKAKNNISFLGDIKNHEIHKHYLANDICILPSTSETWGLVVEEALFYGLPVIISSECGSRDLIINNENGYIINTNNNEILDIITSIDEEKYKTLRIGVEKFSIERKDKEQVELYL